MTIAQGALQAAIGQLGQAEMPKGSNSGPMVNRYLKSVGLGPGYAWCMAFVYWAVNEAANAANVKNPLVKTGGCLLQWNTTTCRKIVPRNTGAVKPGDIFIMEFKGGTGHTGFVESVRPGYIVTIEGNTNDDGDREGYEVARRERPIGSIKGFIQLP